MEIKIGFDPTKADKSTEAGIAFEAGGMVLKFWVLYKSNHLTDQYFAGHLDQLKHAYRIMFDPKDNRRVPYTNIDEFIKMLRSVGINRYNYSWIVKHWDYFNLNIQRKVTIVYNGTKHDTIPKIGIYKEVFPVEMVV